METSPASPRLAGEALTRALCAATSPVVWLPLWAWVALLRLPGVFLDASGAALVECLLWVLGAPLVAGWVAAGFAGAGGLAGPGRRGATLRRTLGGAYASHLFILSYPALLLSVAFAGVLLRRLPGIGDALFWTWCFSVGLGLIYVAWRWLIPGAIALPLALVGGVLAPAPAARIVTRAYAQVRTQPARVLAQVALGLVGVGIAGLFFATCLGCITATVLTLSQAGVGLTPEPEIFFARARALLGWLVTPGAAVPAADLALTAFDAGIWLQVLPHVRGALQGFLLGAFWSALAVTHDALASGAAPAAGETDSKREAGAPA